jgi:2-oxoisovalerate dehydrogenase E1 component
MVIRIPSFSYQEGIGGHFHNENSIAVLRDIPGIIVCAPSNGADAALMLKESVRLADEEKRIVVFLEPIALYQKKDLIAPGDQRWLCVYPSELDSIRFGQINSHGRGKLTIITYANGYYLSRQAQERLGKIYNISIGVIDLRWLCPLPMVELLSALNQTEHVLIVDECRRSGSLSEGLMTALIEENLVLKSLKRITAEDCFIPLGTSHKKLLPSSEAIVEVVLKTLGG